MGSLGWMAKLMGWFLWDGWPGWWEGALGWVAKFVGWAAKLVARPLATENSRCPKKVKSTTDVCCLPPKALVVSFIGSSL
jgi:hypothetical protein